MPWKTSAGGAGRSSRPRTWPRRRPRQPFIALVAHIVRRRQNPSKNHEPPLTISLPWFESHPPHRGASDAYIAAGQRSRSGPRSSCAGKVTLTASPAKGWPGRSRASSGAASRRSCGGRAGPRRVRSRRRTCGGSGRGGAGSMNAPPTGAGNAGRRYRRWSRMWRSATAGGVSCSRPCGRRDRWRWTRRPGSPGPWRLAGALPSCLPAGRALSYGRRTSFPAA